MTDNANRSPSSIKDSILSVLARVRRTALGRGKTELPTAEFSNALNSMGERFIDLLLQNERTGYWWLGENGEWLECTVKSTGRRVTRHFYPGDTPESPMLQSTAKHLADPMTGPDHIVGVSVPHLNMQTYVVLEQKFRFGSRQDAFADSRTYLKHLLNDSGYKLPKGRGVDPDQCCKELSVSLDNVLGTTLGNVGLLGSVPQVCFQLLSSIHNKIIVGEKESRRITKCEFLGFLAPLVDTNSLVRKSLPNEIILRAEVRLWLGLDSLLEVCESSEVETAWQAAINELSTGLHNPRWRDEANDGDEAEG